jgi:thiol-disulfide isomerase/thioredoxin
MKLVLIAAAIVALGGTANGSNDTVLLDFGADWCSYCRQMEPLVTQLAAEGYPVRKVNVDHDHALAEKHGVQGLPCFVMLVDGKEVDRVVGATDRGRLVAMFRRNGVTPDGKSARIPALAADSGSRPIPFPRYDDADQESSKAPADSRYERFIRASVRLHITDRTGISCGSGTIIDTHKADDAHKSEALVLTCGHMFRDADEHSKIMVDLFGPNAPQAVPGQLIEFDLESETGLLSIQTDYPVEVAPVAPESYAVRKGDHVISVGCDGGAAATAKETVVKSINRYGGAANLQVGFQPVQGRSGGGLFTPDGMVIGICNAGDPEDNEGEFTHLSVIHDMLDRNGLALVYRQAPSRDDKRIADRDRPRRDRQLQPVAVREPAVPAADPGRLTADERTALAAVREKSQDAEVICIVRSHADPNAQSEIIVLDHVSPGFLRRLADERGQQPVRELTSLEIPRR